MIGAYSVCIYFAFTSCSHFLPSILYYRLYNVDLLNVTPVLHSNQNTVKPPGKDSVGGAKVYSYLKDYTYQKLGTAVVKIYSKNCVIVIYRVDNCCWSLKSRCAPFNPLLSFWVTSSALNMTWARPSMCSFSRRDRDGAQSESEKSFSLPSSAPSLTINSTKPFSVVALFSAVRWGVLFLSWEYWKRRLGGESICVWDVMS